MLLKSTFNVKSNFKSYLLLSIEEKQQGKRIIQYNSMK